MVPCALCASKKRYGGPVSLVILSLQLMSGLVFLQSYLKGLHVHGFRLSNFGCIGRISELFAMAKDRWVAMGLFLSSVECVCLSQSCYCDVNIFRGLIMFGCGDSSWYLEGKGLEIH